MNWLDHNNSITTPTAEPAATSKFLGSQLVVVEVHAGQIVLAIFVALHHLGLRHYKLHHIIEHPALVHLREGE